METYRPHQATRPVVNTGPSTHSAVVLGLDSRDGRSSSGHCSLSCVSFQRVSTEDRFKRSELKFNTCFLSIHFLCAFQMPFRQWQNLKQLGKLQWVYDKVYLANQTGLVGSGKKVSLNWNLDTRSCQQPRGLERRGAELLKTASKEQQMRLVCMVPGDSFAEGWCEAAAPGDRSERPCWDLSQEQPDIRTQECGEWK